MTVVVRSLVGYSQSLDSVALPAFAMQKRTASTAALVAAVAAKTIQMDVIDAAVSDGDTVQYDAPLTGATLSPGDSVETQIVDPAGTIAALTVNLPANPYDGQHFTLATTQTVTSLTMAATGKTLKGALTAGTANGFGRWKYNAANTTWYRVG